MEKPLPHTGSTNTERRPNFGYRSAPTQLPWGQAGLDFALLRRYLPKSAECCSRSVGRTEGCELRNFAKVSPPKHLVPFKPGSSLPATPTVFVSKAKSTGAVNIQPPREDTNENLSSSTPTSSASGESNSSDNFLSACEVQFARLFDYVERSVAEIYRCLDVSCDYVIVEENTNSDSEDEESVTKSLTMDKTGRKELSAEEVEAHRGVCNSAFQCVRQLRNVLEVNILEFHKLLDEYDRSFPEEDCPGMAFSKSKAEAMENADGQLEQCSHVIEMHKKYVQVRQSSFDVATWKQLFDPRHKKLTLFSIAHFLVFLLAVMVLTYYTGASKRYIALFYLFRGPMIIILYLYLYSINLVGWATAEIQYIDIFGFASEKETPTPYIIFKIAGVLSLTFTLFVAAVLFAIHLEQTEIPEKVLPIAMWVFTAAFLLNPFKIFIRRGRFNVVKVFHRVLFAPLYRVRFGDFWFADQLNSIVVIMLDLEFMACFCSYIWPMGTSYDDQKCNSNRYVARPLISCLPAFWRLMQCLRCFYDTRDYWHLVNAGKYGTTFPVVIFFALFSLDRRSLKDFLEPRESGSVYLYAWVVSSFVHAAYTFAWDVYMDWGLWRSKNLLRPRLLYSWRSLYYLAMCEDFVLRFSWSMKLSLGLMLQAHINIIYTALAVLEVFRRFVWNFYRVEYEQVKIMEKREREETASLLPSTN